MKYHPAVRKMDIKFPCPGLWGMRLLCPVLGSELVKTVWCVNFYSSQGNSLPRHNVSYSKLLVWRMLRAAELKTQRRGQKNSIRQTSLCQTPSLQSSWNVWTFFSNRGRCVGVYEVPSGPVCPSQCHYKAHELFPPFYQTYISGIFSEFRPRCPVLGDVEDCPSPEYQARIMNISQHESDSGYR